MFQYTCVSAAELSFIECITEFLCSFCNFLIDLFVVFSNLVFNQHIGTITFLRVAVIDQRIVERIHVSRSLPDSRMHEDSRINTYDIFMQQYHALPPVLFNVVFQFHTHLSVVIYGSQSIVNFT